MYLMPGVAADGGLSQSPSPSSLVASGARIIPGARARRPTGTSPGSSASSVASVTCQTRGWSRSMWAVEPDEVVRPADAGWSQAEGGAETGQSVRPADAGVVHDAPIRAKVGASAPRGRGVVPRRRRPSPSEPCTPRTRRWSREASPRRCTAPATDRSGPRSTPSPQSVPPGAARPAETRATRSPRHSSSGGSTRAVDPLTPSTVKGTR